MKAVPKLWMLVTLIAIALLLYIICTIANTAYRTNRCNELGFVSYSDELCIGKINPDGTVDLTQAIVYPKEK